MVKETKLLTALILLPYLHIRDMARFCQINKTCCQIMLKTVNFKVLFEPWAVKLTPDMVAETLISRSIALKMGLKCKMIKSIV